MPEHDILALLARRLLPADKTLVGLTEGMRRETGHIQANMAPIIGPGGVRLLLVRATYQAANRWRLLQGVAVYEDGLDAGNVLKGRSDRDYGEVRAAFEDLLVTFLRLLAGLVGTQLAVALARDAIADKRRTNPAQGVPGEEGDRTERGTEGGP